MILIREIITKNIGPHDELLTTVKKRKLTWFGYVIRSNGLAKTIVQGTAEGWRRRSRQKRKWVDGVQDWTENTFEQNRLLEHKRKRWRKCVNQSSCRRPKDFKRS
ncbi:hypothetical protein BsWGS_20764 [Bradybaena similaris]